MRAALLALLVACSSSSSTSSPPSTTPAPDPATGSATQASTGSGTAKAPRIGETCGENDACGEGTCVSYRGIAGARGPEFKTCEIRCEDDGACPSGRKCVTVADGPGRVCR